MSSVIEARRLSFAFELSSVVALRVPRVWRAAGVGPFAPTTDCGLTHETSDSYQYLPLSRIVPRSWTLVVLCFSADFWRELSYGVHVVEDYRQGPDRLRHFDRRLRFTAANDITTWTVPEDPPLGLPIRITALIIFWGPICAMLLYPRAVGSLGTRSRHHSELSA